MHLCLLVEDRLGKVPEGVIIVQDYGWESIVVDEKDGMVSQYHGRAMLLSANPKTFLTWLSPHGETWTSKSPMMGRWELLKVKQIEEV